MNENTRTQAHQNTRIAVAMSGGVDSSVAALLLKKAGHEVMGVNLNLWSCFKGSKTKTCCSPADRLDAARVCEQIGIPFVSIDMREEFKSTVIAQFVNDYSNGLTPNPCIRCNTLIKFGALLSWLQREQGIERLATGHYARIHRDEKGVHLMKGLDPQKDQTYFLFDNPPAVLEKLLFPLGDLTKDESRRIAKEAGLAVAEKMDSQEVCFIPDGDVAGFLEDNYPDSTKGEGNFVDADGKVVGRHRGAHAFTVGQRRGLGVGFGDRMYVKEIRAEKNEIVLCADEDLFSSSCEIENINLIENIGDEVNAEVKIRYRSEPVPAKITVENVIPAEAGIQSRKNALIEFTHPVRAITPGQAAVFYDGETVIGGGWII